MWIKFCKLKPNYNEQMDKISKWNFLIKHKNYFSYKIRCNILQLINYNLVQLN